MFLQKFAEIVGYSKHLTVSRIAVNRISAIGFYCGR